MGLPELHIKQTYNASSSNSRLVIFRAMSQLKDVQKKSMSFYHFCLIPSFRIIFPKT